MAAEQLLPKLFAQAQEALHGFPAGLQCKCITRVLSAAVAFLANCCSAGCAHSSIGDPSALCCGWLVKWPMGFEILRLHGLLMLWKDHNGMYILLLHMVVPDAEQSVQVRELHQQCSVD